MKKNITFLSRSSWEIAFKNQSIFFFVLEAQYYHIRVIGQRRQTAFYAERQNLGSTENSVQDLQQVHRKEEKLVMDNIFSQKVVFQGTKIKSQASVRYWRWRIPNTWIFENRVSEDKGSFYYLAIKSNKIRPKADKKAYIWRRAVS